MEMDNTDDLDLLHLFHQCCHRLHANGKFHGQERLLIQLLEKGPLTQRELIELTGRRSATLSEQLELMEKSGYIIRTKNEQDRRNVDVTLTESGRKAAKEAQNHRILRAHILFSQLDQGEKEQLFRLLGKLSSSWSELSCESEAVRK